MAVPAELLALEMRLRPSLVTQTWCLARQSASASAEWTAGQQDHRDHAEYAEHQGRESSHVATSLPRSRSPYAVCDRVLLICWLSGREATRREAPSAYRGCARTRTEYGYIGVRHVPFAALGSVA